MTIYFFDQRNDYPVGCTLEEWLHDHEPGDILTEADLRKYADRDGDDWWFEICEGTLNQYLSGDIPPFCTGNRRFDTTYDTASYELLQELCDELMYTDEDAYEDAKYDHENELCDSALCDFCIEESDDDTDDESACGCTYDELCEPCEADAVLV